ncbi:MAG TPA: polyprenyl synthetase family protein [Kineosporiaceae bacterium]|nr:polyprenyl synthetase family protein [Kineosporiaceae bacterium]
MTSPWASPLDVEDLRSRVHKALDDFLARQADALERVSPECAPLIEAIADLVRGGKRLRPAFCYWGWRGAAGPDDELIVHAAAAMELFQAAALIHDDVMDGSDTRRGMPSVHRRFAARHAEAGWAGDDERFGLAGAVLAGDLCLVWSGELLAASGLDPQRLAAARIPFDRMRTELMAGQYLDMLEQAVAGGRAQSPVDRARRVIRYKSAKYSVEEPLLIGGTLAGAGPELLATYSTYGLTLGEAFQLRDDVLGVFGDPEETGKPAGDDLREGKRTVLVAMTLQAADPDRRAEVQRLLGRPDLDTAGVDTLRGIIRDTGALDAVERLIADLVVRARQALHAGQVAEPARDVLDALITAATDRTA